MDAYLAILDKQEQNRTIIPASLPQLPMRDKPAEHNPPEMSWQYTSGK